MKLLTDEIAAMIGREAVYAAPHEIGAAAFRAFALAVGDDNPLYADGDFAREHGFDGVVAPPTLVCETNAHMPGERDDDGYIGHLWRIPVRGCRMVRGGNDYELFRPVSPTDRVIARWILEDIVERTTADGRAMLVVISLVTYTDAAGEPLATNRETMLYVEDSA